MEHKSQSEWDERDEKIAHLESELERAYLIIDQMRLEIAQLQNPRNHVQNYDEQPSIFLKSGVSTSHLDNSRYRQKWIVYKDSFNKLSTLQFIALVTAVATGLTIAGIAVTSLITKYLGEQSAKQSATAPKPLTSPSFPPLLPTWAKAKSLPIPSRQPGREHSETVYNVKTPPNFTQSQELQAIVNEVVSLAAARGLPKKPLSITLIDVKTGEQAGYQSDELRFPASVVKMFWMVVLYEQIESGIWANQADFEPYIAEMINDSDNEAASFIVDQITNTQSVPELNDQDLKKWMDKRKKINRFFQLAEYKNINISQKTFPIAYLKLLEPKGSDLQMRRNPNQPGQAIRNKISTEQAARLLYEICYTRQAVSPEASQKMCKWLKRDLNPRVWKKEPPDPNEFNPIRAFLGQSLANTDVHFYSKAGWTSGSRQDAAFVATAEGKTVYILAIFGEDAAYAKDERIFPRMSRLVYNRMTARSLNR